MDRHWSEPRVLNEGTTAPFEITSASIASGQHGDVYIVGRGPYVESDTGVHLDVPFVALKVIADGIAIPLGKPVFSGQFAVPHIGVANDTLHVFWGEADSTAVAPAPRVQYENFVGVIRGIWTSTYTNTWSSPKFVASFFNTNWLLSKGWARSDWSPNVSLALVGIPSTKWTIQWLNASGVVTDLPEIDIGPPLYTTLMSPAPSHLVLGYIMNDFSVPDDHNSVFSIRSTNGGRSWSAPVRIALSGQQMASDVTIVQTSNGILHALWSRNTAQETFGGQLVGYSVSRDTGQSWSPPEYWDAGGDLMNLKAATDTHNGIHLIYQGSLPNGGPALLYTSRTMTSSWEKPVRIFGDTLSTRMPEVTRTSSGDLFLLFSERIRMDGKFGHFVSAVSYLHERRSCKKGS